MDDPDSKSRYVHFLDEFSSIGDDRIEGRLAIFLCHFIIDLLVCLSKCRLNCK